VYTKVGFIYIFWSSGSSVYSGGALLGSHYLWDNTFYPCIAKLIKLNFVLGLHLIVQRGQHNANYLVLRFRLTCPRELLSLTHTFPDTHLYPTHTCIQHTLAPNTHLHPTHTCIRAHLHLTHTCTRHTLAPDTHMYPTHTSNFFKKVQKFRNSG
jgi:hypothetical protein